MKKFKLINKMDSQNYYYHYYCTTINRFRMKSTKKNPKYTKRYQKQGTKIQFIKKK